MAGAEPREVGRYVLRDAIATGGMATVHVGRLRGPVGFARTVAIKRLHPHYARDPEFVAMFLDEARLAARIRHPNVVATVDVVSDDDELFLVMEYVAGEALSRLIRGRTVPVPIALAVIADALHGLHEAHEARDEGGAPLDIVHRDVSPQNVLVGIDGVSRVVDFGIAKATSRVSTTRDGQLKGKLSYMAPEQLLQAPVDRRADVFAASIVLWEALTGARLFQEDDVGRIMHKILFEDVPRPSALNAEVSDALEAVVLRGLARDPNDRFPTAKAMAAALEELGPARPAQVAAWVEENAGRALAERAARLLEIERDETAPPSQPTPSLADVPTDVFPEPPAHVEAPPPRTKGRAALLLLVPFALAIGGVGWYATRDRPNPVPPVEAPIASATASTTATATASASSIASAPPPSAPTPSFVPAKQPTHAPTKKPAPAKPACDPPYYIDNQGVKRFKLGCI